MYEENQKAKTDTIGSGGSHHTHSSTDLGFDEPPLPAKRTGTLSSTDTSRRTLTTDSESNLDLEEEETYVNIQYFLKQRGRCNTGDSTSPHTTLDYSGQNWCPHFLTDLLTLFQSKGGDYAPT